MSDVEVYGALAGGEGVGVTAGDAEFMTWRGAFVHSVVVVVTVQLFGGGDCRAAVEVCKMGVIVVSIRLRLKENLKTVEIP